MSDFGFKGADMSVNPDVEKILLHFHQAGKPIALCCIAPIIAAKVFGSSGVEVKFWFLIEGENLKKVREAALFASKGGVTHYQLKS